MMCHENKKIHMMCHENKISLETDRSTDSGANNPEAE